MSASRCLKISSVAGKRQGRMGWAQERCGRGRSQLPPPRSPKRLLFRCEPRFPSMGFSRQEYCSGLPFPSPGDLPDPGIKPGSFGLPFPSPGDLPDPGIKPGSPALEADALTSEPPEKPLLKLAGSLARRSEQCHSLTHQTVPSERTELDCKRRLFE